MLPYPPSGFECEYKNCCPHLNRISTTWVFKEYRRAVQKYGELWAVINDLDAQLQCANARIGALEEQKPEVQAKHRALQEGQFKFIHTLISQDTPTAQAALYKTPP